jgi:hypothetical protein
MVDMFPENIIYIILCTIQVLCILAFFFYSFCFCVKFSILTKAAWHWHIYRHGDQWDRIQGRETDSCIYSQLIYNKASKHIYWRKTASSISGIGKTG